MTSAEFEYLRRIGYFGSIADKRNAYYNDLIISAADRINVKSSVWSSAAAATASAVPGSTVWLPPGIYGPIAVPCDNVTIAFAPGAEIQVNSWGTPGIDCLDRSGINILGGIVRYAGARVSGGGGSIRGSNPTSNTTGVYINKDRCTVDGLRTINMPVHTYLSSWNGITSRDRIGIGNTVRNWESEGMDFGVLWSGQTKLRIHNGYAHDDIDDSLGANPTHAYYCAAFYDFRASDIVISDIVAENILNGWAYQLKHVDQFKISNHTARHSRGLFNLVGTTDGGLNNLSIIDSVAVSASPTGSVTIQQDTVTPARLKFDNVSISMDVTGTNQRAWHMVATDSDIMDLTVVTNRLTAAGDPSEIRILGTGNTFDHTRIKNIGNTPAPAFQVGDASNASTNTAIKDPRVDNCSLLADFYATGGGTVEYVPEHISLTTGTVLQTASGTPTYRAIVK